LFTSTVRGDDHAGDLLRVSPEQLWQLPPLHTILRGGKRSGSAARQVPVTLAARCTEIGTLEMWCVAKDGNNRWRLEFNVRDIVKDVDSSPAPAGGEKPADRTVTDVWPEAQVEAAAQLLRTVYSGDPGSESLATTTPAELTKALEVALEAPRYEWPTGLCRRLWDFLQEAADQRRKSPAHLGRWYNLVGFCLRPGFGDSLDKFRVESLWKLMNAPPRTDKA